MREPLSKTCSKSVIKEPRPATVKETPKPETTQKIRDFTVCPRCGAATVKSIALNGDVSQFWRECTQCNTFINTFIPQEHQRIFHEDGHRYKGNFGGYGSGKTTTTREEFYKHLFITPNGTGLIGANISAQYEQTIKRDIEADIPAALVKDVSVKNSYITFINGYRLMFRPFDDPGKLRSLNLDFLALVEGSEIDDQIFTVGKTRTRNVAATTQLEVDNKKIFTYTEEGVAIPVIDGDWRTIIVESNPDSGWVKQDVLLASSYIQMNGDVSDKYYVDPERADPAISSHITATSCNKFLPPTYIRDTAKGRPQWWINRYLLGSFTYAEGLVYPSAIRNAATDVLHIVPTTEIPKHWKRIHALDYGLADATGMLWAAIDEERGKLVVYKEFKGSNRNIEALANIVKDYSSDVPSGGWAKPFIIDPKSGAKRDYNKKSLIDHFLAYDISYVPGQVSIDARVYKLNTYFEQDRVEIMDCCTELIKEISDYKFNTAADRDSGRSDKPEDKNNHLINPLEWIVMELPANPAEIVRGAYDLSGRDITEQRARDEDAYATSIFRDIRDDEPQITYGNINISQTLGGLF